jgi:N-acetylneuraminate synthase/N,N'-diacetyllegionaminate synthase
MNLSFIPTLARMFGLPVGLSDHTTGTEAACAALALGARIFEKHLTLDRAMPGPDHQASLDPRGMTHYVATLRALHRGLGDGRKRIMPCEIDVRPAIRRFIVAKTDLPAGHRLGLGDFLFKKVGGGLAPEMQDLLVGARLRQDVAADTPLDLSLLSWDR